MATPHQPVAKSEVLLGMWIECGAMAKAIYAAILGSHSLIDVGMVNHMLLVNGRRPGEHEQVVAFAGGNLSRGERVDFLHRDVVDDHFGIVLLAPFRGEFALKPRVELGNKMGPLCNLQ